MTLPNLRVQLATFRHGQEFYYRAQVLSGDIPIATTIQAWPHNAGCGAAAAISDAQRSLEAIAYQTWIDASKQTLVRETISVKSEHGKPFTRTKGKRMSLKTKRFCYSALAFLAYMYIQLHIKNDLVGVLFAGSYIFGCVYAGMRLCRDKGSVIKCHTTVR